MTGGQRIVVVGASLGGLRAAEGLRAAGFTGELVVIGDEPHLPYHRPPLSKELLSGDVTFAELELRRRRSVDDVQWRLGTAVAAASLASHEVVLEDETVLEFDGLVVATGLRARRLALPAPPGGRHAVRTVEDAVALRADLRPGASAVVIGAGFVGCEVAAIAVGLGCTVHLVAPEEVPLQRPLRAQVGAAMRRRHEKHGVVMHLGRLPAKVEAARADPSRVGAVVLDDGTQLPADVVVEAIGCTPRTEWLTATDLDLADGVRTDGWLRAVDVHGEARPDVVAVGDVARFPNALFDDVPRRVEHWSTPTDTAKRAAPALVAGLTGGDLDPAPFVPVPSFWSDQYGLRLQSFGELGIADAATLLEGDLDDEFVAGYTRRGVLVGVVGIGLMPSLLRHRAEIAALADR